MGQTQETKVFCLFSEHTIDSSIVLLQGPFSLNLRSARYLSDLCPCLVFLPLVLKGTSIYQKKQAGKSVTPFSIRLDDGKIEGAVKKKAGDFIAKVRLSLAPAFRPQELTRALSLSLSLSWLIDPGCRYRQSALPRVPHLGHPHPPHHHLLL